MNEGNTNQSLEIRFIKNKKDFDEIFNIRHRVFVREQNVPSSLEFDGLDGESKHVIVKLRNETIGCARIRSIEGKLKLERIAILKEHRKKGFGTQLVEYLIEYCKQRKIKEIVIHAQYTQKHFYEGFGFQSRGAPFNEAGIKHIEMYITTA